MALEEEIFEQLRNWDWKTLQELQTGITKERRIQSKSRSKFLEDDEPADPELYRALLGLEHRGLVEKRQRSKNVSEWRRKNNGKRQEPRPQGVLGPRNRLHELVPA